MVINLKCYNSTRLTVQQLSDNHVLRARVWQCTKQTSIPCSHGAYVCLGGERHTQLINKIYSVSEEIGATKKTKAVSEREG